MARKRSLVLIVLLVVITLVVVGCTSKKKEEKKLTYKDGSYEGTFETERGPTEVKVTVKEGKINNVQIVKPDARFAIADNWPEHIVAREQIPQRIIAKQALQVDAVAKATGTSNSLIKATEDALKKAKKKK